jgi:hypothetical protein
MLDTLLLDTYNPNCLHDNQELHVTCPHNGSAGVVVKCKKTHVIVQALGVRGLEPGNNTPVTDLFFSSRT